MGGRLGRSGVRMGRRDQWRKVGEKWSKDGQTGGVRVGRLVEQRWGGVE